jgi:GNAT superfamily N-acetyltransferase
MNAITQHLTETVQRRRRADRDGPDTSRVVRVPVQGDPGTAPTVIRRRREDDVDSCARVLRGISSTGTYPVPRPASHLAWLHDNVIDAWVAERRGLILGHVAITRLDPSAREEMLWHEVTGLHLADLAAVSCFFVRPGERDRGVGTHLLAHAVRESRARGLVPVAEVTRESRFGAAIYESHGWREMGRLPIGSRGDDRTLYLYVFPPSADVPEPGAG